MADAGVSIPLVYQLLFLVPGYFTYLFAVRFGGVQADFDRFDKLMFSLTSSGVSITIIYLAYVILLTASSQEGVIAPSPLNLPLHHLAIGFGAHVVFTVIAGIIIGITIAHVRDETVKWHHPWILLNQDLGEEAPSVMVKMIDGKNVSGELVDVERGRDSQDLRLENASVDAGNDEPSDNDVYLYGRNIVRIWIIRGLDGTG